MNLKNKKQKYLLFLVLIIGSFKMQAQQDSQYTQYMYNTISINPAYAGSRDALSVMGLYRAQWIGIEGAPRTASFSANGPIGDRVGLGFSVVNDKIGPSSETNFNIDFSYNIILNKDAKLFFGVKASGDLLNIDYGKLTQSPGYDPIYSENVNLFKPNLGAGVYYQTQNTYIGLSIPQILESTHYQDNNFSAVREKMHIYLMGGYVFDVSRDLQFKPAALIKAVSGAPLQVDLSANFLFVDKFTAGLGYRWGSSVSALAGFQITDGLMAGYAYDFETSKLGNYNSGSHEIFLRFEIAKFNLPILNPRFF